jgi:hypothetical protein
MNLVSLTRVLNRSTRSHCSPAVFISPVSCVPDLHCCPTQCFVLALCTDPLHVLVLGLGLAFWGLPARWPISAPLRKHAAAARVLPGARPTPRRSASRARGPGSDLPNPFPDLCAMLRARARLGPPRFPPTLRNPPGGGGNGGTRFPSTHLSARGCWGAGRGTGSLLHVHPGLLVVLHLSHSYHPS